MEKLQAHDPRQEQLDLWEQFRADMAPSAENRDWNEVRIELCMAFRSLRQDADAAYREWEQEMEAQKEE